MLLIEYARFTNYCSENIPDYLSGKGTEEETLMDVCKDYGLSPEEAGALPLSFICIHNLAKERQAFLQWWGMRDK